MVNKKEQGGSKNKRKCDMQEVEEENFDRNEGRSSNFFVHIQQESSSLVLNFYESVKHNYVF